VSDGRFRFDFEFSVCKRGSEKCIYKSKILQGMDLDLQSYCLLSASSPLTWNVDELPLTDINFQLKALGLYSLTTTLQRVKAVLRDVLLENFRGMLMGVNLAGSEFVEPFDICLDGSFPAIEKRVTFFVSARLPRCRQHADISVPAGNPHPYPTRPT